MPLVARLSLFLLCAPQVLPILEILYHVEDRNSHHVYMALIILLILTEDDTFNRSVHEVVGRRNPRGFAHLYACRRCVVPFFSRPEGGDAEAVWVPLTFTGTEEHHMVL